MNDPRIKKVVQIATAIVTLFAFFFVVQRVWINQIWKLEPDIKANLGFIIAVGGALFFVATVFQPISWRYLLILFDEPGSDFKTVYSLYGRTQIVKYIPGNIFHLGSRHVVSLQEGARNSSLLGAAILELSGYVIVSAFICLGGYVLGIRYEGLSITTIVMIIFSIIVFIASALYLIPRVVAKIPILNKIVVDLKQKNVTLRNFTFSLIKIYGFILIFFTISSIIFFVLVLVVSNNFGVINISLAISFYAIAYLVGFITPGAPAGLGVREAIMIVLLTPYVGESQASLIAFIFRLITVFGDLIFFLVSMLIYWLLKKRLDKN